jgi:hypothetical protein
MAKRKGQDFKKFLPPLFLPLIGAVHSFAFGSDFPAVSLGSSR